MKLIDVEAQLVRELVNDRNALKIKYNQKDDFATADITIESEFIRGHVLKRILEIADNCNYYIDTERCKIRIVIY